MPALWNRRHEIVARELAAGKHYLEASAALGDDGKPVYDPNASSFKANARKRAQHPDIRRRVAELQALGVERAEQGIGVTIEYVLEKLCQIAEYNIDDYLTPPDQFGHRHIDVARAPRELLARLNELTQENAGGVLRTKIRGYDKIAALALMAKILGATRDDAAQSIDRLGERIDRAIGRTNTEAV